MNIKLIVFLSLLLTFNEARAQVFDYDSTTRRILVSTTDLSGSEITVYSDLGEWAFHDALSTSAQGAFSSQTALQVSDIQPNAMCATSYVSNSIIGSHPGGGDAQNSFLTSFTLANSTRFKIEFFGAGHSETHFGYLHLKPQLTIKGGHNGNGDTFLNIQGGGIEYLELPAGDYRLSTAVGASYNCSNNPDCDALSTGYSQFSVQVFDSMNIPGTGYDSPFVPDAYFETESADHTSVTPNGSVVIRGENSFYNYNDAVEGWFDIGSEPVTFIEMQSDSVVKTLQLPGNLQGQFKVAVGNVVLGDFMANDVITFGDYSTELGGLLIAGSGGTEGVKNIEITYTPVGNENNLNACGEADNTAVKLTFDDLMVTFDVVMPFTPTPDGIFENGFDG